MFIIHLIQIYTVTTVSFILLIHTTQQSLIHSIGSWYFKLYFVGSSRRSEKEKKQKRNRKKKTAK